MTRPRCSCPLPWVRALYQCPHGTWHTPVTFHDPDTGEEWPGWDHADDGALPCCNFIEAVEEADCGPCGGTMRAGWPEFVCDTCGARCGAQAHPTHAVPDVPTPTQEQRP